MRVGNNPSNEELVAEDVASHRVIIPVYIPHEDDYFKDAFQIFEYCLFVFDSENIVHAAKNLGSE